MLKTDITRVAFRLLTLSLLALSLWMITAGTAKTPQTERHIAVNVAKQLETVSGVIPAEIRCGSALIRPSEEVEFSCKLRNNSGKKITAAAALYAVVIEKNGVEMRDEYSSVSVKLVGPHFEGLDKATGPGEELSIGPPGPLSYGDAVIKGVEISIEFVEFDGDLTLGEDGKGAQVVKDFREGAAKYRGWMKGKYEAGRKSGGAIAPLLEAEKSLPAEVGLSNQNQEFGAKAYRRALKKKSDAGNHAEVDRLLSQ